MDLEITVAFLHGLLADGKLNDPLGRVRAVQVAVEVEPCQCERCRRLDRGQRTYSPEASSSMAISAPFSHAKTWFEVEMTARSPS